MTNSITEAISLIRGAKMNLEQALESLNSASNWGLFDLLGGGLISGLVKHSRVNDADEYLHMAQHKLKSAQRLLQAQKCDLGEEIAIGGVAKFFDLLGDGLFSGLWVQGKIEQKRRAVGDLHTRVCELLYALERARR